MQKKCLAKICEIVCEIYVENIKEKVKNKVKIGSKNMIKLKNFSTSEIKMQKAYKKSNKHQKKAFINYVIWKKRSCVNM